MTLLTNSYFNYVIKLEIDVDINGSKTVAVFDFDSTEKTTDTMHSFTRCSFSLKHRTDRKTVLNTLLKNTGQMLGSLTASKHWKS